MPKPSIPHLILRVPSHPEGLTDLRTQFAIANAYALTAAMADDQAGTKKLLVMVFPAFICSSFSLELFLKLFVVRARAAKGPVSKPVRGHSIRKLWGEVTTADKEIIAGFFRNDSDAPWPESNGVRVEVFETMLNELDEEPFVKWRYLHELSGKSQFRYGALAEVLDAVRKGAAHVIREDPEAHSTDPN